MCIYLALKGRTVERVTAESACNPRHLTDDVGRKIIGLFGLGVSYRDIASHIAELYGLEVSQAIISSITDRVL